MGTVFLVGYLIFTFFAVLFICCAGRLNKSCDEWSERAMREHARDLEKAADEQVSSADAPAPALALTA